MPYQSLMCFGNVKTDFTKVTLEHNHPCLHFVKNSLYIKVGNVNFCPSKSGDRKATN